MNPPDIQKAGFDWHGRRHGKKLRVGQQALVDGLLPKIRIDDATGCVSELTADHDDIWMEIGFGGGEHLAAQAAAHPKIGFIGCEPFVNGVAKLLTAIDSEDLGNIRIHDDDARPLLDALPQASIGRAFVLFADPWPKTRHNKRRFINGENLDRLARVLKDGAELRFASDHGEYVSWALQRLTAHRHFSWTARSAADWRIPPGDWTRTRYEQKALDEGRACSYLSFQKVSKKP